MAGLRIGSVLLALSMAASTSAQTNAKADEHTGRLDLSVNYVADIGNARPGVCGCFAMNGGGTEEVYYLRPRIAAVVDVSAVHTSHVSGTNAGLGLATFLAGPRYVYRNKSRYLPYAQAQVGSVIGFDAIWPGSSSATATSVAWALGGGVEMKYRHRFGFRLIEASYLNTRLPNNATGTQNNLKLTTGIILHLK